MSHSQANDSTLTRGEQMAALLTKLLSLHDSGDQDFPGNPAFDEVGLALANLWRECTEDDGHAGEVYIRIVCDVCDCSQGGTSEEEEDEDVEDGSETSDDEPGTQDIEEK